MIVRKTQLVTKQCEGCPSLYEGGLRSRFCPECLVKRRRDSEREYRIRQAKRPMPAVDSPHVAAIERRDRANCAAFRPIHMPHLRISYMGADGLKLMVDMGRGPDEWVAYIVPMSHVRLVGRVCRRLTAWLDRVQEKKENV